MDKARQQHYQTRLLEQQTELLAMEAAMQQAGETVELDQTRTGRLTRMDALQSQQIAKDADRRRQQQLARIEGALNRIEAGEFGHCFICGEEIITSRLDIDPTSTRCMTCVEQ